jgi:hypothetical protein
VSFERDAHAFRAGAETVACQQAILLLEIFTTIDGTPTMSFMKYLTAPARSPFNSRC